jgi:hypothetical protein
VLLGTYQKQINEPNFHEIKKAFSGLLEVLSILLEVLSILLDALSILLEAHAILLEVHSRLPEVYPTYHLLSFFFLIHVILNIIR